MCLVALHTDSVSWDQTPLIVPWQPLDAKAPVGTEGLVRFAGPGGPPKVVSERPPSQLFCKTAELSRATPVRLPLTNSSLSNNGIDWILLTAYIGWCGKRAFGSPALVRWASVGNRPHAQR